MRTGVTDLIPSLPVLLILLALATVAPGFALYVVAAVLFLKAIRFLVAASRRREGS